MKEYKDRDLILEWMGFESYHDYLSSSLWEEIREKALACSKQRCVVCKYPKKLTIHHYDYSEITLKGISLDSLIVLCKKCHASIEFYGNKKRTLAQANGVLASKLADKMGGHVNRPHRTQQQQDSLKSSRAAAKRRRRKEKKKRQKKRSIHNTSE